jgi:hypothetical protein
VYDATIGLDVFSSIAGVLLIVVMFFRLVRWVFALFGLGA